MLDFMKSMNNVGVSDRVHHITKYSNTGNYYDRTNRKVLTNAKLYDMVREGRSLHIFDYATNKDVTVFVLTRLLLNKVAAYDTSIDRKDLERMIRS